MFQKIFKKTNILIWGYFVVFLCACSGSNTIKDQALNEIVLEKIDKTRLFLEFSKNEEVLFFGKISSNQADALSGNMMYPGDNAGVFLVSILTHAAVQSSVTEKNRQKRQDNADLVLDDYKQAIEIFNGDFLLKSLNTLQVSYGEILLDRYETQLSQDNPTNEFVVKVLPAYYLTQNANTLVLNIQFNFYESLNKLETSARKVIEIVSDPIFTTDSLEAVEVGERRARFIETGKTLFHQSLKLALETQYGNLKPTKKVEKTIRYEENGRKKVERGTMIINTCNRQVFTTLRGVVKSVPKLEQERNCKSI